MNRKAKALLAAAWMCTVSVAAAQDRFPPIAEDKMTPAQKRVSDAVKAGPRGALNGPFIPLLRSPELDNRVQAVGEYLRFGSAIGRRLTEFTILITARHWTQNYEWATHYAIAIKEGIKKDVADAIGDGRRPTGMTEEEEIVYEFCTELQENKSVTDATFARAQKKFGDQGVIDMTGLVGYYTLLATILNVARTPTDVPNPPILKPFPK
ncbi:MAG: carboxymuconolactone decarboxylase family protein [Bryobacteraceae bacterium]